MIDIFIEMKFYPDHTDIVGETIEGVDPNGKRVERNCQGWTALMMAVFQEESDLAMKLFEAKADVLYTGPDNYNCASTFLEYLHSESKKN